MPQLRCNAVQIDGSIQISVLQSPCAPKEPSEGFLASMAEMRAAGEVRGGVARLAVNVTGL